MNIYKQIFSGLLSLYFLITVPQNNFNYCAKSNNIDVVASDKSDLNEQSEISLFDVIIWVLKLPAKIFNICKYTVTLGACYCIYSGYFKIKDNIKSIKNFFDFTPNYMNNNAVKK